MKNLKMFYLLPCFFALSLIVSCGGNGGGGGGEDAIPEKIEITETTDEGAIEPQEEEQTIETPQEEVAEIIDNIEEVPAEDTVDSIDAPVDTEIAETTEEGGGAGACNNSADLAIIGSADVQGASRNCGFTCISNPNFRQCVRDCLVDATHLSTECADCYAGIAECTKDHCMLQCATNPDSTTCRQCLQDAGCIDAFLNCSGLPPE